MRGWSERDQAVRVVEQGNPSDKVEPVEELDGWLLVPGQKIVTEITYLKDKSFFMVPFEIKTGFELKVRDQ